MQLNHFSSVIDGCNRQMSNFRKMPAALTWRIYYRPNGKEC